MTEIRINVLTDKNLRTVNELLMMFGKKLISKIYAPKHCAISAGQYYIVIMCKNLM